ncbi:hypothetical protein BJV82DRAFT_713799 [Fennellomyces sp. T-0311]|nr:hypothetical protein BJV82DRAFT_713799 [Fennellomyces sp. T-0311]
MAAVRTNGMSPDLATQNEELWRIVEKQRVVIQNLQKSLTLMTDERDNLLERNQDLEQDLIMATQFNVEKEPVKVESTPKSPTQVESKNLLADTIGAAMLGPVPPPRSPYRQIDNTPSAPSANSSTSNLAISSNVFERYGTPDSSETRMGATIVEPTLPATYAYDRTKAPPSPNPYRPADKSPRTKPSNAPIDLSEGFSNTTLDLSLPPVEAMVERDTKYQGAHQRKDADHYPQYQYKETAPLNRKPESQHPLSSAEHANGQQHNHHYQQPQQHNYQYPPQQRYQPTPQTDQAAIDYHHRNETNNLPKRPADDYRQWQQSEHARATPAEDPGVPQSLTDATPTTPPSHHQQSPSSPQGTFATGLMAGINTKVIGSETITNDKGKEVIAFTISVRKAKDPKDLNSPLDELWQVQKLYSDFLALDVQLKAQGKSVVNKIAKLPDRALFSTHVSNKADQRKMAIDNYLQHALRLPLSDITDICEFLSSNVMEAVPQPACKVSKYRQGYLTKRGKNFGGWKRRYFMLDGPELKYYESEEGMFLGKIVLTQSQIGKQKAPENPKESPDFKHGLIILEPKKSAPGGLARHVLCADNDDERDAWVAAMTQHIDQEAVANRLEQSNKKAKKSGKISKDDIKPVTDDRSRRSSLDPSDPNAQNKYLENLLMGSSDSLHSNDDDSTKKEKGQRKAFWSKKMFAGNGHQSGQRADKNKPTGDWRKDQAVDSPGPNQVFGIPLEDAIKVAKVTDQYELPAIVYRCIDYLEAKNAIQEEGIYRLSGSAVKIRNLKSKFNEEGDVDLLASGEHYDIHAVSGLLKMWLRELPGNVLTTELLKEFLNVMDLVDRRERINELGRLVSMLPLQNYTLLRTLSAHLIRVVQNAGTNKMTMRNVGIVFSATLGIPTGIFSLLLTEFDYIFWTNDGTAPPPISDDPASKFPLPPTTMPPPTQVPSNHTRVQALQRETGRSNRNSVNYRHGAPRSIVGLEQLGSHGPIVDDGEEVDDLALEYSDEETPAYRTAERQPYVQPHQVHPNSTPVPYPTVDTNYLASRYY